MKVSCETHCLWPRGEFEQPPVPDSLLGLYPEMGERGCELTRSTPVVPEAAAGHGAGREQGSAK